MKELKALEQEKIISDIKDFHQIEEKFDLKIPTTLKEFIFKYEGAYFGSLYYNNEPVLKEVLYLSKHPDFASIEAILEGHKEEGIEGFVPFAIDSGGWDYCVSIKPETYGQVWVDKFDSGEENPMEFVASSFEEFIDGLGPEE